ncbi:hypothetical protein CRV03_07420 [Arcobacter sp. F155]|uniref:Opr family porin n=1 Tax=Arcobacter sp. F155 TaxID=2044512 RepID=UPI00102789FA|nr:Opr family porin [Arcobacter sp. F155]RXJ77085.1 hypothetical protein CRV03_07420 [Arcobacter sp. F155]
MKYLLSLYVIFLNLPYLVATENKMNNSLNIEGNIAVVSLYNQEEKKDIGFTHAISEFALSKTYKNWLLDFGLIKYSKIDEVDQTNYPSYTKPIIHRVAIEYQNDFTSLRLGRQRLSHYWIGSFHEAAVLKVKPHKHLDLSLIHSQGYAWIRGKVGFNFSDYNKEGKGVNVFDINYTHDNFTLNPYIYYADKLYSFYGIKSLYRNHTLDVLAHYVISDEENKNDRGSVFNLELSLREMNKFDFSLGFIQTNKNIGSGSIGNIDENINPAEEANAIYKPNAKSKYLSFKYKGFKNLTLESKFLKTTYMQNSSEEELDFIAEYKLTNGVNLGATFAKVNSSELNKDYISTIMWISYKI